jgi:hypothetical protein
MEISTVQVENRVRERGVTPFHSRLLDRYFKKRRREPFFSISGICFMLTKHDRNSEHL